MVFVESNPVSSKQLMKATRTWPVLFWCAALADIALIYAELDSFRWATKPLLMPLLIVWLTTGYQQPKNKLYTGVLLALLFSWAGDVLLQLEGLFIPGLVSFLLAHICYIYYFCMLPRFKQGIIRQEPLVGLPVLVYVVLFLWLLYPFLDSMKLPVTVYALTIGIMMLAAINTRQRMDTAVTALFFNGALQFVLSDSLLAVNLFAYHHVLLSVFVMLTYSSAQYLLVKGALRISASQV
jgi:uncharacterized membrane protein YhhN